MKIKDLIRRAVEDRAPKPAFVRIASLLGGFVGILISGYGFEGSLLSLAIGTVAGFYIGKFVAIGLLRLAPERVTITDEIGIWAVRVVSFLCGVGCIAMGIQLFVPIRSPWEFDRISGAGFLLLGVLVSGLILFGRFASRWPRLTWALYGSVGAVVFVASLVAFVQLERIFFLVIALFGAAALFASYRGMRKPPTRPYDELTWYVFSGRLPPPERRV